MSNTDLKGKVALITDGGGGLGSAAALRLARSGASIAVVDLFREPAEKIAELIRSEGHTAAAFQADLGDSGQIHKVVDDVVATFGRIDIVHNNAVLTSVPNLKGLSVIVGLLR